MQSVRFSLVSSPCGLQGIGQKGSAISLSREAVTNTRLNLNDPLFWPVNFKGEISHFDGKLESLYQQLLEPAKRFAMLE